MNTILYIIVPCYNEEEVILITSGLFLQESARAGTGGTRMQSGQA